ncbi:MAG: hypothetical protein ACYS99_10945 [Planctomycetota bacterium]|jgi:hypothetical protein
MRASLLLLLVLVIAGCASTDAVRSEALVSRSDAPAEGPERFMGDSQDTLYEHLRESLSGVDFLWRSVTRNSARDWERVKAFFR